MRLVCPNCGAQYEVDDRVIPEGGRDVQCSNCGHAWYQRPAGWEAGSAGADADLVADASEDDEDPQADAAVPEDAADVDAPAVETPAPKRRELDDGVRDILEEEAKRELSARARDTGGMEAQPELGLDAPEDPEIERRRLARERVATMRGVGEGETLEPEVDPEAEVRAARAPAASRRKDVFPDIDEINSSLDGAPAARAAAAQPKEATKDAPRGNGFRRGFSIMILLGALAFGAYVLAPNLAVLAPNLADELGWYVTWVNGLLAQLETIMADLTARIEG